MDIFQQNWKDRIQTDPFVNKTLNNYPTKDRVGRLKWREKQLNDSVRYPGTLGVFSKTWSTDVGKNKDGWDEDDWNTLRKKIDAYGGDNWWTGRDKAIKGRWYVDPATKEYGGIFMVQRPYEVDVIQKEYHANARPQSLYNLRYASLRK